MSLINYILFFILSYHVNNKTLHTFDFLNYMHLPLKRTSKNKNFETKRTNDPQLRTIAAECTLHCIVLRHCYVHVCYIHLVKDGFHTAGTGL